MSSSSKTPSTSTVLSKAPRPHWYSFELQQLLQKLERDQGADVESLLSGSGVSIGDLEDPSFRVTLDQELELYVRIANSNTDPLLSLKHGKTLGLNQFGLLGQAMLSSETLFDALGALIDCSKLFSWEMEIRLQPQDVEGDRCYELQLKPTPADSVTAQFEIESSLASFYVMVSQLLVDKACLKKVSVSHVLTDEAEEAFRTFLNCPIHSKGKTNGMVISTKELDRRLPYSEPEHRELLLSLCQKNIQALEQERGLLGALQRLFECCASIPTIEDAAAHFSVSSRTLRRQLNALGDSYQGVVDRYRFAKASDFLHSSDRSIEAIARSLGYSDVRSFRTAFKRWSGVTPSQYRAQ